MQPDQPANAQASKPPIFRRLRHHVTVCSSRPVSRDASFTVSQARGGGGGGILSSINRHILDTSAVSASSARPTSTLGRITLAAGRVMCQAAFPSSSRRSHKARSSPTIPPII
jgi:hypothetical protein